MTGVGCWIAGITMVKFGRFPSTFDHRAKVGQWDRATLG